MRFVPASFLVVSILVGLVACGAEAPQTAAGASPTPSALAFRSQVDRGGKVYGASCAECHGAGGEGSARAPRLVGLKEGALPLEPRSGAKRTSRFVTVGDVAAFAVKNMPPEAPGSLAADDYWAVLAFDLSANGIELDKPLGPEVAGALTIPR